MLIVSVPQGIQQTLIAALRRSGSNECGGVVMGEHVGENHFAVRNLTIQSGGSFARFVREAGFALRALKDYFKRANHDYSRFNYLGEWHSHPSFSTQPSDTDHRAMVEIVTDPKVGANFAVLLIFRLTAMDALEGSAHTYLPDGSIFKSTLSLEILV